jgi:F-type H+-transporting ATPase subunit gamma
MAGADSMAAQHAARLSAMQSAERNIAEKLQEMHTEHCRARQNAITTQLLDIIAGSAALRSALPGGREISCRLDAPQ